MPDSRLPDVVVQDSCQVDIDAAMWRLSQSEEEAEALIESTFRAALESKRSEFVDAVLETGLAKTQDGMILPSAWLILVSQALLWT